MAVIHDPVVVAYIHVCVHVQMTKCLARRYAPQGVRFLSVAPGAIMTPALGE